MRQDRFLIFVYNADSETVPRANQLMSRPTGAMSESCKLLTLTYSPIGMKKEWKRFLNNLKFQVRFLARDEFTREFRGFSATFPVAFYQSGKDLFILASTEEINQCRELEDLVTLIDKRLVGIAAAGQ